MARLRFLPALLLPWLAALATAEPAGLLHALSAKQVEALEHGKVVVAQLQPAGGKGYAYTTYGVVEAPPARAWEVIQDCEHLQEYMPRMVRSVETQRTENSYVCDTEIELPFPLSNRRNSARSFLEQLPGGVFKRHWSLVDDDGDYYRHDGSWTIHPWGESGQRSLLEHWIDSWPKNAVPDFIVHAARTLQAPAAFEAIRQRVRELPRPDVAAAPSAH